MTLTIIKPRAGNLLTGAKVTVISGALRGPTGPAGPSGGEAVSRLAATPITGHYLVASLSPTHVFHPDPSDYESISAIVGIALQSGSINTSVNIQTAGVVSENSWSWTAGEPVFAGTGGMITQVPPVTGALRKIGVALSATDIAISLGPVIRRQ